MNREIIRELIVSLMYRELSARLGEGDTQKAWKARCLLQHNIAEEATFCIIIMIQYSSLHYHGNIKTHLWKRMWRPFLLLPSLGLAPICVPIKRVSIFPGLPRIVLIYNRCPSFLFGLAFSHSQKCPGVASKLYVTYCKLHSRALGVPLNNHRYYNSLGLRWGFFPWWVTSAFPICNKFFLF